METENSTVEHFCRTCLVEIDEPSERYNILNVGTVAQTLTTFTSIAVDPHDSYPKFLCELCYTNIQHFEEFRSQAIHSFKLLTEILNEHKYKYDEDPDDIENTNMERDSTAAPAQRVILDIQPVLAKSERQESTDVNECDRTVTDDDAVSESDEFSEYDSEDEAGCSKMERKQPVQLPASRGKIPSQLPKEKPPFAETHSKHSTSPKSTPAMKTVKFDSRDGNSPAAVSGREKSEQRNQTADVTPFVFVSCEEKDRKSAQSTSKPPSRTTTTKSAPTFSTSKLEPPKLDSQKQVLSVICTYNNCRQKFKNIDLFRLHYRREHRRKTAPVEITCPHPDCSEKFTNDTLYRIHYRNEHVKRKEPPVYICEHCGKTCKTTLSLKMHRYKHVPESEYPFACEHCPKRFYTPRTYKVHLLRHAGIKKFECPHCGLKKTTSNEIKEHINLHTKEKRYICKICSKEFSRPGGLSVHTRVIHRGIKPYSCRFCSLSFGKTFARKQHEMTHTGERPYTCEICKKGFIQAVAWRGHMRTHEKRMAAAEKD